MKKTTLLLVLSFLPLTLASCGKGGASSSNNQTPESTVWDDESSVKVDALSATIEVGSTYQINASGKGSLTYSSTNEEVATVNASGLVSGIAEGDTAIKITSEDDFVYVRIHVGEASGAAINGTLSVYLPASALTLYIGENYEVTPKAMVSGKELEASFTYSSSNESVATVADGKITAVANGTAVIKVVANSGGNTASGQITVTVNDDLTYLVPDFESREVVAGSPVTLNVALIHNSSMVTSGVSAPSYSIDNDSIAYISNNQLFAVRKGTVTLTASVTYQSKEYSCSVEIYTKELYKVTYTSNGQKVYEENVISGGYITYEEVPSKIDCVFKGWGNGDALVDNKTPINNSMDLVAKWLVYSSDINSEYTSLLWEYSTGTEITCNNNAGCYLWEDFQYPDSRVNVQLTYKSLDTTEITFPKFEYSLFPAVSFYFYNQIYNTKFAYGSYTSGTLAHSAKNQVSIVGNKLYFNGTDTGQTVSEGVLSATEPLKIKIKSPLNNSGKMVVTGFYGHLSDE